MITDIKNLKEKLLAEKKLLEEELTQLGKRDPATGDWEATPVPEEEGPEADSNELADHFEDFEERSATLNELEKRLREIEGALKKIEDGTYGLCDVGKEEIESDRLLANPAATTCKKHMR